MKRFGLQHVGAEDRVDVLCIRADDGNEATRPIDARLRKTSSRLASASIADRPVVQRRLHSGPAIALDDDKRHLLAPQLRRHDAADAAVSTDDEMILDGLEHAFAACATEAGWASPPSTMPPPQA